MQRKGRARPLGAPENAPHGAGGAKTKAAPAAKRTPRTARRSVPTIDELRVSAFKIPTDSPESDGTYKWDSTTIVIVEAEAGGEHSLGYGYADEATAHLIESKLKQVVLGRDALSVSGSFVAMGGSIRNLGRPGICSMAISAVDTSLWDLKAKLLGQPLVRLFGQVREAMPLYGSGGFTSYTNDKLQEQLGGWLKEGFRG